MNQVASRLNPPYRWQHPHGFLARRLALFILALAFGFGAGPGSSTALAAPLQDQQIITVPINKSRILDLRDNVARVSVANPGIADILVINPKQIYINGKELGSTNMIFWDHQDQVQRQVGLEVTHDLETVKEKLYRLLPGERIRIESAQGSIVLSGTASSPARMESALNVAKTYGPVINLLQVGGAQQVLLEVKVAEVRRELGKQLDSNLLAVYDDKNGFRIGAISGQANNLGSGSTGNVLPFDILTTGILAGISSGNFKLDMYLRAAETEGLARILAEPNLTTLSGQEADFLSGGQFPVQVLGENGTVGTEWKDYGIKLKFVPFVLSPGQISLKVNVSVSELGPVLPTTTGDAQSVLTRGANATVEIPSGQTIALAGMLSENARDGIDKFPGLGSIPILGALFRSQEFRKDQTELIIFVTPKLANSFDPKQARLPTDDFVEPNDTEFYLLGKMTNRRSSESGQAPSRASGGQRLGADKSGTEGAFGHDL